MKIDWYRKRSKESHAVPAEVSETDVSATARDGQYRRKTDYQTWMDELIHQHQRDGGFDNLEGKGKPLNLGEGVGFDGLVNRVLKEAKFLPPWLELQHEVYRELQKAVDKMDKNLGNQIDWVQIQSKVRLYNAACPHSTFQKPMVTADNLRSQLSRWESQEM